MNDRPDPSEQPSAETLGDLVARLSDETGALVQAHVALAKAEVTEDAKRAAMGSGMLAAAAIFALLAITFLSSAAAWGIALALDAWAAFLIVGGFWALVAIIVAVVGRSRLKNLKPTDTIETFEEDRRWLNEMR
jgi:uncharacterized membrane protein YqjE